MKIFNYYHIFYLVTDKPGSIYVMDDFGDLVKIDYPQFARFFLV